MGGGRRRGPGPGADPIAVIPRPRSVERGEGAFRFGPESWIGLPAAAGPELEAAAGRFAERLRRSADLPLPVRVAGEEALGEDAEGPGVRLALDPRASGSPEGYRLSVRPEGVRLAAPAPAGLFYGLQTLRQLLPPELEADGGSRRSETEPRAPAVEIRDAPRFPWRGLHLDVARHFFPLPCLERWLDVMALFKLDRFHWHLTDDQGWRLEIRRHPRLTEVGAWRRETVVGKRLDPYAGDGTPHGGFYAREEARGLVAYAAERFITVVPEIEMPGHARAALAAYPELACTEGPFEPATTWGPSADPFCPTERTFRFLEEVLEEVTEIFPGPWVHLGGDEVPTSAWEESEAARAVARREGLGGPAELHGYFLRRVAACLRSRDRRAVVWDDALASGLPPEAVVMAWRGVERGAAAARRGHEVVMAPAERLYFDRYQGEPETEPPAFGGHTPLEAVYEFEPVPGSLEPEAAARILGAQACLWTEYMKIPERVEYMAFPRLLALAEVAWSPAELRDPESFARRLPAALARLDALGVRYRRPEPPPDGATRSVPGRLRGTSERER